jgi:hypothetical protein
MSEMKVMNTIEDEIKDIKSKIIISADSVWDHLKDHGSNVHLQKNYVSKSKKNCW